MSQPEDLGDKVDGRARLHVIGVHQGFVEVGFSSEMFSASLFLPPQTVKTLTANLLLALSEIEDEDFEVTTLSDEDAPGDPGIDLG